MTLIGWLASALGIVLAAWMATVLLTICLKILKRHINLRGMLAGPSGMGGALTRPQMLIFSLVAMATYAGTALANLGQSPSLPDADEWLLITMGGSHLLYLGGRSATTLLSSFMRR